MDRPPWAVYTRNVKRGRRIAAEIEAGTVYINHPAGTYEDMPFAGIKKSGTGRDTDDPGIHELVNKWLVRVMPYGLWTRALPHTAFPVPHNRPLCHLSGSI